MANRNAGGFWRWVTPRSAAVTTMLGMQYKCFPQTRFGETSMHTLAGREINGEKCLPDRRRSGLARMAATPISKSKNCRSELARYSLPEPPTGDALVQSIRASLGLPRIRPRQNYIPTVGGGLPRRSWEMQLLVVRRWADWSFQDRDLFAATATFWRGNGRTELACKLDQHSRRLGIDGVLGQRHSLGGR